MDFPPEADHQMCSFKDRWNFGFFCFMHPVKPFYMPKLFWEVVVAVLSFLYAQAFQRGVTFLILFVFVFPVAVQNQLILSLAKGLKCSALTNADE